MKLWHFESQKITLFHKQNYSKITQTRFYSYYELLDYWLWEKEPQFKESMFLSCDISAETSLSF